MIDKNVMDIVDRQEMSEFLLNTACIRESALPTHKNFLVQWATRHSPITETYAWLRCESLEEAQHIVKVCLDPDFFKLLFLGEKEKVDLDIPNNPKYFKGKTVGYGLTKEEFEHLARKHNRFGFEVKWFIDDKTDKRFCVPNHCVFH
jgi:hypothetical protein